MPRPPRHDRLAARADKRGSRITNSTVNVNINLPSWLVSELRLLCIDPATGKMPHGAWSLLIEDALAGWLRDQKATLEDAASHA